MREHLTSNERVIFYRDNPKLKKEMIDFMHIEEGIRCLAMRPDPNISDRPYVYKDPNKDKEEYNLRTLTNDNFYEVVKYARTLQYLTYIYDEDVQNCKHKFDLESHIIGLTPVIDIDSERIDPEDSTKGRYDIMLQENKKYFGNIVGFINKMEEKLIEYDEPFKVMFSGNGFQLILDNYYPDIPYDIEDINNFRDKIIDLIDDVCQMTNYEFVDTKKYTWNNNMKLPHTFHFNIPNRLSKLTTVQRIRDVYNNM